jgi:dTDP-4-dehydrorhamnose reductase
MKDINIYITGASGQVGKALRYSLQEYDIKTFILHRAKLKLFPNETHIQYCLGDYIQPIYDNKINYIFHLAYDSDDIKHGMKNINFIGLEAIKRSFRLVNSKKIIFISTPNASKKSTNYNLQKYLAEQSLCNYNSKLVIRPSFLFSEHNGANSIFNKIKFMNIPIPIPKNKSIICPLNVNTFASNLIKASIQDKQKGLLFIAGNSGVTFKLFLKKYHNINTFYMPNFLWRFIASVLQKIPIGKFNYISERIMGLLDLKDFSELSKNKKVLKFNE